MAVLVNSESVDRSLHTLFKRCVQCPTDIPSCPTCPNGQICSLISQSCTACASMTCIASGEPTTSSSPNIGAIVGGVVGGILVVAVATFLIWWFFIRAKRAAQLEQELQEDDIAAQKAAHDQFIMQRSGRASVHTVNSVATSLLSRASNMIPIAYIPGVMNRDGRNNSDLNVPPVPPIPAARGPSPRHSSKGDVLFFKPGDLRDSTYSDVSSTDDDRSTFYGRPSITPSLARSSIATFRDDAVDNPMPVQTITRAKANMVSVSSSQKTSPNQTPPNEIVTSESSKQAVAPNKNMNGASFGKPTLLTLTKKSGMSNGRFPIKNVNSAQHAKPTKSSPLAYRDDPSDDEDDIVHPRSESVVTPIHESPMPAQSPFADPSSLDKGKGRRTEPTNLPDNRLSEASRQSEASFIGMGGLKSITEVSSIIENATKRASRVPSHQGLGGVRDGSPFGDENETN